MTAAVYVVRCCNDDDASYFAIGTIRTRELKLARRFTSTRDAMARAQCINCRVVTVDEARELDAGGGE